MRYGISKYSAGPVRPWWEAESNEVAQCIDRTRAQQRSKGRLAREIPL